jgi:hypothetical protein
MSRDRHQDEEGLALITVMLAVLILSGLVTVFVARSVTETTLSTRARDRETALHAAEAATDDQLAAINADKTYVTLQEDGATQVVYNPSTISDEESWARGLLDELDASDAFVTTETGEAFAFRPVDTAGDPLDVLYGVGASPSFSHADPRFRVVKLQIAHDLFKPDYAILTNGSLTFGGAAEVIAPRCDDSNPARGDCNADVHVNETFTNPGGASTVEGRVTVAGSACPPDVTSVFGCQDTSNGVESYDVREIPARNFYGRELDRLNPDQEGQEVKWWDLCPDGTVRPVSPSGPCTSATIEWPDGSNTSFRGWDFTDNGSGKSWDATSVGAGVFYVHHADASINGSAGSLRRAVSVFVEEDPTNPTQSGSLSVRGNPLMEAAFPDVLLVADSDIELSGTAASGGCDETPDAMSGLITMGEQFATTGTVELRGAVLIQDLTDADTPLTRGNDKVQGTMCLEFDEDIDVDIDGYWTITYWNEL